LAGSFAEAGDKDQRSAFRVAFPQAITTAVAVGPHFADAAVLVVGDEMLPAIRKEACGLQRSIGPVLLVQQFLSHQIEGAQDEGEKKDPHGTRGCPFYAQR
jgi:hypothetical protein